VPKAAGSTVSIMFKDTHYLTGKERSDPSPFFHHMGVKKILELNPSYKSLFKFAITRNPFDRLLSGYTEFKNEEHRKNLSGKNPWPTNINDYSSFHEFCIDLPNSEWIKDPHFVSQTSLLYNNNSLGVEFIAKQENLFNDLMKIKDKIGVNDEILKEYILNTQHRKTYGVFRKGHYSEHYNKQSKKIVETIFQTDLENFNYQWLGNEK
jgi:hypothetical protein